MAKKDGKKKPMMALVISVGPKMPKKPMDAATPDMKKYGSMPMKKYGSMPMKKAFELLKRNYTRDSMPSPSRYDDEGFEEYDMEDMGPPYGKPEFGDEDSREAEMKDAERAAIMAEGVPEMPRPRGAPRPGDPRLRGSRRSDAPPNSEGYPPYFNSDVEDSAHNQSRPKYPRDIFAKAWDMLKAERRNMPESYRRRIMASKKPEPEPQSEPEPKPEIPTSQKVAAAKQQFDFINNIRRKRGEPPISIDEHLQQAGLTLEDYDREYHPEVFE